MNQLINILIRRILMKESQLIRLPNKVVILNCQNLYHWVEVK